MKNLKRVLSMALASVMLVGTMVVGASAVDFTDGEEITHTEAVNTMVSLNIINGKDDGSFDPEGTVTRAEMAKMITVALNGGTAPVLGTKATPTYTDIKGHWAESFIEYCSNLKIINGRGNGIFDPEGKVTGTEAAKMVLVAMGYDSTVFNFTGADWAIAVNTEANNATPNKLYAGIEKIDPNAPLSRDAAAQMIYNGVQDHMMVKSPSMTITNGEITWEYKKDGATILSAKYNAHVYTAVVEANEYAGVVGSAKAGEFKIKAFLCDDETINQSMTVKGTVDLDLLGKAVKIIIADTKTGGVYNTVYGDPMLADVNNIYTVNSDKTSAKAKTFQNDVESAGIKVASIDTDVDVYLNYLSTAAIADVDALQAATANGKIIEVIDNNGDSEADYIMIKTPAIGQVTTYNEKGNSGKGYITVAAKSAYPAGTTAISAEKFENVIGVEDIAKDDFISFFELSDTYFVEKLETVDSVVSKKIGDNEIVVDGEHYKRSALTTNCDADGNTTLKAATNVGDEVTLYLDASGYVVYTSGAEVATSYAFLYAIENVGDITGARARAVFADGTEKVINIVSVKDGSNTYKVGAANAAEKLTAYIGKDQTLDPATFDGQIFKYSESDGDYKLTVLAAGATDSLTDGNIIQGNATLKSGVKADSKTIFLVKDNAGNYTPYTGIANVPTMKDTVDAFIAKDTGVAEFVVVVEGAPTVNKSIYILDKQVTVALNAKGDKIYTVAALVDGEYNEALELSGLGEGDSLTVTRGLYAGDDVVLANGALDADLLDGTSAGDKYYADAANLTLVKNGNVTGMVVGTEDDASGEDTLTLTNDTKFIIVEGTTEDKIFEGSADDLAFDKTATDRGDKTNNAKIIMVRANSKDTEDGYGVAGTIYIIR